MKNMFDEQDVNEIIGRINNLSPGSEPIWGKMDVAQMLAHCCVTYEFIYENNHAAPGAFKRLLLKAFVKPAVVGDKPYKRNSPTAPEFLIKSGKDFSVEKNRLIDYIRRTQTLGSQHFDGKESRSFGKLTLKEWNTMFAKHLDHHLSQFGV